MDKRTTAASVSKRRATTEITENERNMGKDKDAPTKMLKTKMIL